MDSKGFRKISGNLQDTSKSTVGSASMRPLPYLSRFLFHADSEIAPQPIYCLLCIGPTTGLCSLLSQRNPGPSPWTPYDWNYVYYMWQIPHHTPKTRDWCETLCARIATGWNMGRMPSVAIHVISHSVRRSHDRWYFVSRGFRDAVLLYYWSCPYSRIAEYVQTSYIPQFVRANYKIKITVLADPSRGRRGPS